MVEPGEGTKNKRFGNRLEKGDWGGWKRGVGREPGNPDWGGGRRREKGISREKRKHISCTRKPHPNFDFCKPKGRRGKKRAATLDPRAVFPRPKKRQAGV